jgi:hypothetical protein
MSISLSKLCKAVVGSTLLVGQASWADVLNETFDAYSVNQLLSNGMQAVTSLVTWRDRQGTVAVSSAMDFEGKTGGKSLRFFYPAEAHEAEQRIDLNGKYPELWIGFKILVPSNYAYRAQNNNKFLMVYNDFTGNTTFMDFETWAHEDSNGRLDGTNYIAVQYKVNGVNKDFAWGPSSTIPNTYNVHGDDHRFINPAVDRGKWLNMVFHLKLSDTATSKNGASEVWKNGEKIVEVLNINNFNSTANHFSGLYLLGWANTGYAQDTTFYIDNLRISEDPLPITGSEKFPRPPSPLTAE